MGRNKLVMSFVKWIGGKRQLLGALEELLSVRGIWEYCEPFFEKEQCFSLQSNRAHVNGINSF